MEINYPIGSLTRKLPPGPAELLLLSAFLFFLPLYEAPKNIALYMYLIFRIKYLFTSHQLPRISIQIDLPLLAIFILSIFTVFSTKNWNAGLQIFEFFSFTLLFLFVKDTKWDIDRHLPHFLTALVLGTAIALVEGLLSGERFPSLRSVGHINQVAIFLAISYFIFAASKIYNALEWRNIIAFIAFTCCIFLTDSRNAVFSLVLFLALYILVIIVNKIWSFKKVALFCLIASISIGTLSLTSQELIKKQLHHLNEGSLDSSRMGLWRTSLLIWHEKPFLGHGTGSFREVTSEVSVKQLLEIKNQKYKNDKFFHSSHGHNLIFHWLVERGLIATLFLVFWLCSLLLLAVSEFRINQTEKLASLNSQSVFGLVPPTILLFCVFSIIALGTGNTTLQKEHGLLTMFFLGFSISTLASKNQIQNA